MTSEQDSLRDGGGDLLSVVVRVHQTANLKSFDEALFSLSVQQYEPLEVLIVGDTGQEADLEKYAAWQPWTSGMSWKILSCQGGDGQDNRSAKLNEGIRQACGRYLAFLDYDDAVYQHGYHRLIERLRQGTAALAAGGSRMALRDKATGFISDKHSQRQTEVSKADLWHENVLSIHSFVIDRQRIAGDLSVDQSFDRLEDYFFLLKLSQNNEFDFALLGEPVCEYRVTSVNGSGTARYVAAQSPQEQAKWNQALARIEEWKSAQSGMIEIAVVSELVKKKRELEMEVSRLNAVANENAELAGQMQGWKNSAQELAQKCDSLGSELKRRPYAMTRRLMGLGAPLMRVYRKFR